MKEKSKILTKGKKYIARTLKLNVYAHSYDPILHIAN